MTTPPGTETQTYPQFPSAPPWAVATAAPATTTAQVPVPVHGGLLVRFPQEMQHAPRAQPPAVWPVAVFTLLFGILGLVSAKRRADRARRGRNSTAPYWVTYLVAVAAGSFLWFVAGAVAGPVVDDIREDSRLTAVQRNVLEDGQLKKARITATAASCRPVTERDVAGMRDYLCRLTLTNGKTASLALTADTDGQWRSRPTG